MLDSCMHCPMAKSNQLPFFFLSDSRASDPLELLHLDLWGPAPCLSTSGARYFSDNCIQLNTFIEKQLNTFVKCIQSDNGGEYRNKTCSIVSPPPGSHVVRCRWIYKIKYKSDGSMDRYKGRLVAQGFTQTAGVD